VILAVVIVSEIVHVDCVIVEVPVLVGKLVAEVLVEPVVLIVVVIEVLDIVLAQVDSIFPRVVDAGILAFNVSSVEVVVKLSLLVVLGGLLFVFPDRLDEALSMHLAEFLTLSTAQIELICFVMGTESLTVAQALVRWAAIAVEVL